jgi:hypothetical protein
LESLDNLIRITVANLGRSESVEVSIYIDKLEADWLTAVVKDITGRDVESMNKYMPLLLAEEVHRLL